MRILTRSSAVVSMSFIFFNQCCGLRLATRRRCAWVWDLPRRQNSSITSCQVRASNFGSWEVRQALAREIPMTGCAAAILRIAWICSASVLCRVARLSRVPVSESCR